MIKIKMITVCWWSTQGFTFTKQLKVVLNTWMCVSINLIVIQVIISFFTPSKECLTEALSWSVSAGRPSVELEILTEFVGIMTRFILAVCKEGLQPVLGI